MAKISTYLCSVNKQLGVHFSTISVVKYIALFLNSRDSASSADEGSCSGLPSPSKQKNTKYKIPSDDHTYVRQKSNQGTPASMLSDGSEHSQSQNQSQEGVTLTSSLPSASSAAMITTLELHSEQTSSQEHETLTTTKCPEQFIDQKPPLLGGQTMKVSDSEISSVSASKQTSENSTSTVSVFMKSVNDAIDKAVKEELQKTDDVEMKSKTVPMDTNVTAAESENKKETGDQSLTTKQEMTENTERKASTESDQSVIIIDMKDDGEKMEDKSSGEW